MMVVISLMPLSVMTLQGLWREAPAAEGSTALLRGPGDIDGQRRQQGAGLCAEPPGTFSVNKQQQRKGDGVDWPDRWGRTPLHWAAVNGHIASCKVGCKDAHRRTASRLHFLPMTLKYSTTQWTAVAP